MLSRRIILSWRRLLGCGALVLGLGAQAAFPAPCERDFPTREAYEAEVRALQREAEESLREKIAVGQERFEQRMQFRQALVDGRLAQASAREQQILAQLAPPGPRSSRESRDRPGRLLAWLGLLTCVGIIGWQAVRRVSD